MILFNIHYSTRHFSLFLILLILSTVNSSRQLQRKTLFSPKLKQETYKNFAKICHIDDYSKWFEQQKEFMVWLDFARMLRLPIEEDKDFQRELKKYRLQFQCLRLVERLAVSIGPG